MQGIIRVEVTVSMDVDFDGTMFVQLRGQVFEVSKLVTLRAAGVFVAGHVLHLP